MLSRFLFIILALLVSNSVLAQEGILSGKIISNSQEEIEGATVSIDNLNKYSISNAEGDFTIDNLNAGVYTVKIAHLGFKTQFLQVNIISGQTTNLSVIELEEANNQLNEVIVSGSLFNRTPNAAKAGIKPLDLPQSAAVISQQTLENQQINSLTDILKNTNGVYIMGTTGGYQEEIASRGYSLGSSNTFKNGVRYFNGMRIETSGIEQAEILKGSAAILFGNVQAGGILNLVTKKPQFEFGGEVDLTLGSFDLIKPTFDVYGALNESKTSAFRLNGSYTSADSYRKFVSSETYYINPSFLFKLGKKTNLLIEADYTNDSRTPDFGAGIINYQLVDLPREQFTGVKWGYFNSEQLSVTATLNHQFSDSWGLTYINSFRHYNTNLFANTRPNTSGGIIQENGDWQRNIQKNDIQDNYNLNQFDLKGVFNTGFLKHQFLVGADVENYRTKNYRYNTFSEQDNGESFYDVINIFKPDYANFRNDIPQLDQNRLTTTPVSRFGIYIQDLIRITDYVKVLAGVRYTYQDTESKITNLPDLSTSSTNFYDDAFTPRFGLIIQPTKHNSIFASYANSFETNTGIDINGNALEPSIIDQFEIGLKNEFFGNKLLFNITAYLIKNSNLAQTSLTDNTVQELAGATESKGVEVDLTANPVKGLRLLAGYSFNEMKYTESNIYIVGSSFRYNPKHTANLSADYRFESGILNGLNLGVIGSYFGERFAGRSFQTTNPNSGRQLIPLSDYFQLDATIGYILNNHITLRAKLANCTNELNYNIHDDNSINPIAPRNYSVSIGYKF